MRVRFWGTRGSCPAPGPETARFGGNTTCLEVRSQDDELIILDAGTGIRDLGRALVGAADGTPIRGDLFFSHAHWDHIQGLPFFTPAFQSGNHFRLWGSPVMESSLEVVLRQQMSPVVFPVAFDQLLARMEFAQVAQHRHSGSGYNVQTINVRHPGGALGFRLSDAAEATRSMVFIPDNELDRDGDRAEDASTRDALVEFARGATVLIHDAMYTGSEYMDHRGWGHSSYRDAIDFAIAAEVETLVLFHHEPDRSDTALEEMLALCHQMVRERQGRVRVLAAAEGMQLDV
ncbi:MAG: MBL fold metallo-hydrolase [Gemmatimonadaceae bacterium]|nr:MBL fold metallo-hydrolase [Gemmatimonadaceae bacterium]